MTQILGKLWVRFNALQAQALVWHLNLSWHSEYIWLLAYSVFCISIWCFHTYCFLLEFEDIMCSCLLVYLLSKSLFYPGHPFAPCIFQCHWGCCWMHNVEEGPAFICYINDAIITGLAIKMDNISHQGRWTVDSQMQTVTKSKAQGLQCNKRSRPQKAVRPGRGNRISR